MLTSYIILYTAWKVSKYGDFSGPYFPVFNPNTGKYGPEKTSYLDNFHAVVWQGNSICVWQSQEVILHEDTKELELAIKTYLTLYNTVSGLIFEFAIYV